jgi:hypothetical protein
VALDRREFLQRAGVLAAAGTLPLGWDLVDAAAGSKTDRRLRLLSRELKGPLYTRSTKGFTNAARIFNEVYEDVRPLAVARCVSAQDVQACVKWASKYDVPITSKSGGHSYAGYSTRRSGLVVDLSRLSGIDVASGATTASIGPGAKLIEVYSALARRSVTIPAGSCPTVGIGGLTLGGGVGLASRKFGLTSDNLVAAQVVTADGRILSVDGDTHEDLFWALQGGGGGNFGIVTRFRFNTHRVSRAAFFFASWSWSQAVEAVAAWQAFAPHAPPELFSLMNLQNGGGSPSVTALGQYFGSASRLSSLLGPLRRSGARISTGTASYLPLQLRWAGCAGESVSACAVPDRTPFIGKSDYASRPLSGRGRATMKRYIERAGGRATGAIILDSYGGAINRVKPSATAFVHRNMLFSMQYYTQFQSSSGERAGRSWIRSFYAAMRPFVSGFAYQNYIDPDLKSWRHAYYGKNYKRLQRVKKTYDPGNLFHFKQSIRLP